MTTACDFKADAKRAISMAEHVHNYTVRAEGIYCNGWSVYGKLLDKNGEVVNYFEYRDVKDNQKIYWIDADDYRRQNCFCCYSGLCDGSHGDQLSTFSRQEIMDDSR